MSNSYSRLSRDSVAILTGLYESPTGSLLLTTFSAAYLDEAAHSLEKHGLIEHLTKTDVYQITPLGIYVLGLVNEKTKEVANGNSQLKHAGK